MIHKECEGKELLEELKKLSFRIKTQHNLHQEELNIIKDFKVSETRIGDFKKTLQVLRTDR